VLSVTEIQASFYDSYERSYQTQDMKQN